MSDPFLNKPAEEILPWARPETIKEIKEIQEGMRTNRTDGYSMYERLRKLLIDESEWKFEQEIQDYPFVIECPVPQVNSAMFDYINSHITWLGKMFPKDSYLAFPDSAAGKHKTCCRNVYFKNASDAVLFKITRL